jgi:sigma-B regulation protein RsbU (phosphoserine phosphatase)
MQGQRGEKSISFVPMYDPKQQMWYQNAARTQRTHWAVQVGKSNWSEIFSFFGQTWLSVTQSKPLFKNGKFLGVVAIDFTLTDLSRFLHELSISPRGQTFIMERDGKLIATSTQEKLYSLSLIDKKVQRLVAYESQSLQIRQTAQFIQQNLPHIFQIQQATQFDYWLENERQWVKILPFSNDNLDWLIVVVVPEHDFTGEIDKNTRLTILSASVALLSSLLLSLLISHWVIRPISYLNQAAHHLAQRTWTQLPVERTDELGELAHSFNRMAKQLQELFEHLEAKVHERTYELAQANEEICTLNEYLREENQRMGTELEITRKLQQMVLPRAEELLQIKPLDIAAFMEPAAEVGGDYYDILQDNGRIKIGIGDVTGHGLESGVLMLMVQTAVRVLLSSQITDSKVFLNILNHALYHNLQRMQSDKNLTLLLIDYDNGKLRFSGQHEEILYINQFGKVERIDTFHLGFMVGIEPDIAQFVAQYEMNLAQGEGIVLYTDGVTEAMNEARQFYGLERLCDVVSQHWSSSALEIQQAVINDLRHHLGKCKLQDDVTLLVIKQRDISPF